jgi:hypothetical protein
MLIVTQLHREDAAAHQDRVAVPQRETAALPRLGEIAEPNGPDGVSEAMSGGTPGRSEATAIQANGTAQNSAAALAASIAQSRPPQGRSPGQARG